MTPQQPKEASIPWMGIMIVCAAGILFWAVLNLPSERYGHQHSGDKAEYSQESTLPIPKSDASIDSENKENADKSNSQKIAQSNLSSQWVMANIAWMGSFIGIIGIGFIAWTLHETRNAARSARDTLGIAQDTLAETQKTTALEMQPYLSCEWIKAKVGSHDADSGVIAMLSLEITNKGKTPAYIIMGKNMSFGSLISQGKVCKAKGVHLAQGSRIHLGPGETENMLIADTYKFDNYAPAAVPKEFAINGDVSILYTDHFTPKGEQKAVSYQFLWNKTTRLTDTDKVRMGRTTILRTQNYDHWND